MRTRGALFSLSYFHALMVERCKFGPIGFATRYPFSTGDLACSITMARHYVETSSRSPWDAVRFIVGEVLYGGHIVNDFDRAVCTAYCEHFFREECLDGMELFPFRTGDAGLGFKAPAPTSYARYMESIESSEAVEVGAASAFGLHPNAEIGFRTGQANALFDMLIEMQVCAL